MKYKSNTMDKAARYEAALALATRVEPMSIFNSREGLKGIYRLPNDFVRTFLMSEVERKRNELYLEGGENEE